MERNFQRITDSGENGIYSVRYCRIKMPALLEEVEKRRKPMLVFCSNRIGAERTASVLRFYFNNENIRFYHTGLQYEEKAEINRWFCICKEAVLVTVDDPEMSLHKKNAGSVIYKNPPSEPDAYIRRSKVHGRNGYSETVLLLPPEDAKPARYAEDEALFIQFIKMNKRSFTKTEAVAEFAARMPFWRAGDVKRLIDELLQCGAIKVHTNLLWKGMVDIGTL